LFLVACLSTAAWWRLLVVVCTDATHIN
jgi:hypothetical protein